MQIHNIQGWLTSQTTWGISSNNSDVRTLRTLNKLYQKLSTIGEVAVITLLVGVMCACAWLITRTSYEDVIFWDETDHICLLDSSTGKIRYATSK